MPVSLLIKYLHLLIVFQDFEQSELIFIAFLIWFLMNDSQLSLSAITVTSFAVLLY
jgi:hypothetical protein